MSDSEHEVKVNINSSYNDKGVKDFRKDAGKLNKEQRKLLSDGMKQQKASNRSRTVESADTKKRLAAEAKISAEKKKQTQEMREQARLSRAANYEFRKAQRTTFKGGFGQAMGFENPNNPNRPNRRSQLGRMAGGALRTGIGMAGGGLAALAMSPIAAMSSQYQAYYTYQRQLAGLSGMHQGSRFGGPGGLTQDSMRQALNVGADRGFDPNETVQHVGNMGRAIGSAGAVGGTGYAQTASRSTGLDMTAITSMFAEQRRGAGGFGEGQVHEFQRMLQAAVRAGMDTSTLPEAMEGVQALLQGANTRGGSTSGLPYMQLLSMMGASGIAGLQGSRGAAAAGGMEEFVRSAGTGSGGGAGESEAIRMMLLQQAGYGRGRSLFGARRALDRGFQEGGIGVQGFSNVVSSVRQATGGDEEATLDVMASAMHVTQDAMADIIRLLDGNASAGTLQARLTTATETELDVMHSIDSQITDFLTGAQRAAGITLEDIDAGEDFADPLEALQDIMRDFVRDMRPIIEETLPLIETTLREVTTAVSGLVLAINDTLSGTALPAAVAEEFRAFSDIDRETTAGLRAEAALGPNADRAAVTATRDQLQHANDLLGTQMDDTSVAISRFARGQSGYDQERELQREQAIDRLNAILTRMESRQDATGPTPVTVVTDTSALDPHLQGLRPATPRSTVDTSGGAAQ